MSTFSEMVRLFFIFEIYKTYFLNQQDKKPSVKIAVIGKGVVGKSSLTYRFINYNAPTEHDPTIEDRYKSNTNIDGTLYEVEILDTAGEDDYQNMMDMWISFGEGFLLVFAINDNESFEAVKKKKERVVKGKHVQNVPLLLVGNKQDLSNERQVPYSVAKETADSWGIEYIETSAKTNFNCKEAFEKLAKKIVEQKKGKKGGKNNGGSCCRCVIF